MGDTNSAGAASERLPRHVAIIMDGNGRWAGRRGLPRTAGHKQGAETFRKIATYCKNRGLDYLTVYAFSTENWRRPAEEVGTIMGLLERYLLEAVEKMEKEHIRLKVLGDVTPLSPRLRKLIARCEEIASGLPGCFQANICLNYGGRDEILRAAKALAAEGGPWTEEALSAHLDSGGIPDPELIIRPGGEYRISNFLLWQGSYAEYYFTDTLWPDFGPEEMEAAFASFQKRDRRFGGLTP